MRIRIRNTGIRSHNYHHKNLSSVCKKIKESGVVSKCGLPDSGASNTSENLLRSLLENGEGVVALFVEDFQAGISLD
jgi:hypothetical protein